MTFVLAAVIVGLVIDRWLMGRRHKEAVQMADILTTKVIRFAEGTNARMAVQAEETRVQVSEMATRVQHPELMRPDIGEVDNEPSPPVYDDEDAFAAVGQIVSEAEESVNGDE